MEPLHIILAAMITLMGGTLVIYLYYLYSSKERAERIERRGTIPFIDEPVEEKDS